MFSPFSFQYPVKTYGYAFIFSLTGYLGVNFVLNLVKSFGALLAVTGNIYTFILLLASLSCAIISYFTVRQ